MVDSSCALSSICARYCCSRCGGRPGWRASRARPVRPFSGVRISWLVLARKSLLARLAASAASSARANACAAWRASVTSSAIQMVPLVAGWRGSMALARRRAWKVLPSRRATWHSVSTASPRPSAGPTLADSAA